MKKKTIWLVISCFVAAAILASCAPVAVEEEEAIPPVEEEEVAPRAKPTPPIPEPAKFEVISLDINPPKRNAIQPLVGTMLPLARDSWHKKVRVKLTTCVDDVLALVS